MTGTTWQPERVWHGHRRKFWLGWARSAIVSCVGLILIVGIPIAMHAVARTPLGWYNAVIPVVYLVGNVAMHRLFWRRSSRLDREIIRMQADRARYESITEQLAILVGREGDLT